MNALLLAAGYGTRMQSISGNTPKALLPAGDRLVLDYLMEQLRAIPQIERTVLVTNARFHEQFVQWAEARGHDDLKILNDGTASNEERLGAVGDLRFALRDAALDNDLLVSGTDNVFLFDIAMLVDFFSEKKSDVLAVVREPNPARVSRSAAVTLDGAGRVVDFAEKPETPTSDLISPPLYIFKKETLALVDKFLDAGHSPDSPGCFLAWLHGERPVYGLPMEGDRRDIGSPESYREACDFLRKKSRFN